MRTIVIGDLNVDIIVIGSSQLPVLGHEISCKDIKAVMGGSASIFACRLAQLDAEVDVFGKLGNDENGRIVLKTLNSSKVGIDKLKIDDSIRTGVTLSLTYPENKAQITSTGGIDVLSVSDIKPGLFRKYNHLHVSSIYLQRRLLTSLTEIFEEAKEEGLRISLDTNADPLRQYDHIDEILKYIDIFLPNESEAKDITGSTNVKEAIMKLSSKVPIVVIKCGNKGAIGEINRKIVNVNPIKIEPVDTTGAGDSFNAGFIYYFLNKNKGFKTSLSFANALGALSCLYIGGAEEKITENDVIEFMSSE